MTAQQTPPAASEAPAGEAGNGATLRIALLGCGSVGSQVARLLREQAADLAVRTGARLELAGIAVRRRPIPGTPGSTATCSPPTR